MNSKIYNNKIVHKNITLFKKYGVNFIEPEIGHLMWKNGIGKLAKKEIIIEKIINFY